VENAMCCCKGKTNCGKKGCDKPEAKKKKKTKKGK
jgi:hypothetical protein